jgi:preprotein translocase subunit YajC
MPMQALAQTSAPAAGAAPAGGFVLAQLFPFLLIIVVFYFLVLAPGNKEKKKREEMLKAIQRGDKVLTRGGLWGHVADIKENTLTVKISENTRVEVDRSYIESVEKAV